MLTVYGMYVTATFGEVGIPVLLIRDSASNNIFGNTSSMPVTVGELLPLVRAVSGAARRALVIADLPFGSYEASADRCFHTAVRFTKEAGAHGEAGERPGNGGAGGAAGPLRDPRDGTSSSFRSPSTASAATGCRAGAGCTAAGVGGEGSGGGRCVRRADRDDQRPARLSGPTGERRDPTTRNVPISASACPDWPAASSLATALNERRSALISQPRGACGT